MVGILKDSVRRDDWMDIIRDPAYNWKWVIVQEQKVKYQDFIQDFHLHIMKV